MPAFRGLLPRLAIAAMAGLAMSAAAAQPAVHGERYFVEFRARGSEPIGHTFIVYGRINAAGRVVELRHSGFTPKGDVRHALVFPVPGVVGAERDDSVLPASAIYRRWLSADDYRRLLWKLRQLHAKRQQWHLIFFNCNDFAIEMADTLRLKRLPSLVPPQVWVDGLRAMNGGI